MTNTPFYKITLISRWLLGIFFWLAPLTIFLSFGVFLGAQRVILQEQERLSRDFFTLTSYVKKQDQFLQQLRTHSDALTTLPFSHPATVHEVQSPVDWQQRLFLVKTSATTLPFSLICRSLTDCAIPSEKLFALGSHTAEFYASFWASSPFPAPEVFLLNTREQIGITVPALETSSGDTQISIQTYQTTLDALQRKLSQAEQDYCQSSTLKPDVVWFTSPTLPNRLIGFLPLFYSTEILGASPPNQSCIYAITIPTNTEHTLPTLPDPERLAQRNIANFSLYHQSYGLLFGNNKPVLPRGSTELRYTLKGLTLQITEDQGIWTGIYRIPYADFFLDNISLPITTLGLLLLSVLASYFYIRWYNRHVLLPAQLAQDKILESDAFNRTLLDTAPVALCLISRENSQVIFANALALEWLSAKVGEPLPSSDATALLLSKVQSSNEQGIIEQLFITNKKTLYVAFAPTRYMMKSVTLCVFTDITIHAEIEHTLIQARQAAEQANMAKSTFLATMSHEIRTPLYGSLGTLELLSLTQLDEQQRHYVNRIDDASQMLLKIISNILDISKIEAGQLQIDQSPFNLGELVQNTTSSYAGMANRKGLLLFSTIASDLPPMLIGDPIRIRQILSNLISNAIKFTDTGHVIVRLSLLEYRPPLTRVLLEVCDSGIGISPARQEKLFTAFYLTDAKNNTTIGSGLGLSICHRLAELMNSKIQLRSKLNIGSVFFCELTLNADQEEHVDTPPNLSTAHILVLTPHPELTANICDWLQHWGADSAPFKKESMLTQMSTILLEIVKNEQSTPILWPGQHLVIPLSGDAHSSIDVYNIKSIGFAIERLIHHLYPPLPAVTTLPHFNLRILVAEDNPLNQIVLQEQLEVLGCNVTLVENGEEALALWDINPYDIILTDVNMPRMNGYELAATLRSEGVSQPILAVTANAMHDEEQRCLAAGMNGWLVKPITLEKLAKLLHSHINFFPNNILSDEHYFEQLEPDILTKHRDIFLQIMWEDWQRLNTATMEKDADNIAVILHRMRGAFVLAQQKELSAQMELLEHQIDSSELTNVLFADLCVMVKTIQKLLSKIEKGYYHE